MVVDTTVNVHGWIEDGSARAAKHPVGFYTTHSKRILVGTAVLTIFTYTLETGENMRKKWPEI